MKKAVIQSISVIVNCKPIFVLSQKIYHFSISLVFFIPETTFRGLYLIVVKIQKVLKMLNQGMLKTGSMMPNWLSMLFLQSYIDLVYTATDVICEGECYSGSTHQSGPYQPDFDVTCTKRVQGSQSRSFNKKWFQDHHWLSFCTNRNKVFCFYCRLAASNTSAKQSSSTFIRASPKRLALFEKLQTALSQDFHTLKPLCPTRWTVRTAALKAVLENWSVLCSELEIIQLESSGEPSRKACGLLAMMDKFSVYFGLRVSHLLFSAAEEVSKSLQRKEFSAQEAYLSICQLHTFLDRQRSSTVFEEFFVQTVELSKDLTEPPVLPRPRRLPKRIDDGSKEHQFTSVDDYYRKQYYKVIDLMKGELDRRFQHPAFEIMREIENLLVKSCNGVSVQTLFPLSEKFTTLYCDLLDLDMLKVQLAMLPDLLKTINEQQNLGIKSVTSVSTIVDLINANTFSKTFLSQVDRLLRIYLTVPMNTATAERTFSCLRRLKNYLRSTMSQKRLNHVILTHTHKERTDLIDVLEIAELFISVNDRRRNYFGKIK